MLNIPRVTKNLLIVNFIIALATVVLSYQGINLNRMLGLQFFLSSDFHIYQIFTYMFVHAPIISTPLLPQSSFSHILFNMFALWMFGSVIERVWGTKKFLFYYITCGVGAGLIQELVQFCELFFFPDSMVAVSYTMNGVVQQGQISMSEYILSSGGTVGASGAVYGILLAFGMIFPNERLFIIPIPFPIKAKWLIVGYIAIELFSAMTGPGDGVAHMAHLGGMLFGFLLIRYWRNHPDSSQRFGRSRGQEFFDNLRNKYEAHQQQNRMKAERTDARRETDHEYNARQRQNQEEIDAILDKIRKSGYDSLTKEEKKKLFDQSRHSS